MDSINDDKRDKATPHFDVESLEEDNPESTSQDEEVQEQEEVTLEPLSWEQKQKMIYRAEEAQSNDTNKKVAKTAVKAVSTAFGGPEAGAAADAINKSGVADPVYEKIATAVTRASTFNPLMRGVQKKLNQAEEDGIIDAADKAVDVASLASGGLGPAGGTAKAPTAGGKGAEASAQAAEASEAAAKKTGNPLKKATDALGGKGEQPGSSAAKAEEAAKKAAPAKSVPINDNKNNEKKKGKGFNFEFLTKHPMLIIIILGAGLLFILFLLIMSLLLGGGGADYAEGAFLDTRYDFTASTVDLTNSYQNEANKVVLTTLSFDDFIKGATYAEMYQNIDKIKNKEDMVKVFKSYMIVVRSLALSFGHYNYENKELEIQSGPHGIPYCDIYNGCDVLSSSGVNTYVTTGYDGSFKGTKVTTMDAASSEVIDSLNEAYNDTRYIILVPKEMNELLQEYKYPNPPYSQNIKNSWLNKAPSTKKDDYQSLITSNANYENYKIYNLEDYAVRYNYSNNPEYWWPIGNKADSSGIHSGKPLSMRITSPYGYRFHPISNKYKMHSGIDIGAGCGTPIVATRSGTVKVAKYNSSYGYYIDIDHGNGVTSRYAHILEGGIMVAVGQSVTQGQQIAKVGTTGSSTGCHLHFEIRVNGSTVPPLDYISEKNPRPKVISSNGETVSGNSNMQSVCLTLKQVGFSDNAVAGIMTNMKSESGFRVSALGDSGTSYGLCQWHGDRNTRLRNYCGSNLNTVGCQIDYLIYELKKSYGGVYNYLRTNNSAYDMANYFCLNFEKPYQKHIGCPRRAQNDSSAFLQYVTNGCN